MAADREAAHGYVDSPRPGTLAWGQDSGLGPSPYRRQGAGRGEAAELCPGCHPIAAITRAWIGNNAPDTF